MKIFTIGYQNLSPEVYSQALVASGVGIVLDVREHAWSYRPAFVKGTFERFLRQCGISYMHCKSAGNPAANRKTAKTASECMRRYRAYLRKNPSCLQDLLVRIRMADEDGRPACLTCYERDYNGCHRSVLINELLKLQPALETIHLAPMLPQKPVKPKRLISEQNEVMLFT